MYLSTKLLRRTFFDLGSAISFVLTKLDVLLLFDSLFLASSRCLFGCCQLCLSFYLSSVLRESSSGL